MPVEPDAPPWFTLVAVSPMNTFTLGERRVEFFGNHLRDGDGDAVAHIHLAEIGGDRAVGIDGDVARELIRRQRGFYGDSSLPRRRAHRQLARNRT